MKNLHFRNDLTVADDRVDLGYHKGESRMIDEHDMQAESIIWPWIDDPNYDEYNDYHAGYYEEAEYDDD